MTEENNDKNEEFVAAELAAPAPVEEDKSVDLLAMANDAAARLEAANKITAELLTRQEALQVQKTLGGSASAGAPVISEKDKKDKNARDFLKGTGYEDLLFPE